MDSFFAKLFLDLQERIKIEAPDIRWTEQNFGQYSDPEFPVKVAFPAVLIDFTSTSYSGMSGSIQLGTPMINLVLLFNPFSQSYNLAPEAIRQKALEYYEIEHKLASVLNGWSLDYFSPLTRTYAKSQNRNEIGLRIRELDFTTEFEDWSTENETTQPVTMKFTGNVGS